MSILYLLQGDCVHYMYIHAVFGGSVIIKWFKFKPRENRLRWEWVHNYICILDHCLMRDEWSKLSYVGLSSTHFLSNFIISCDSQPPRTAPFKRNSQLPSIFFFRDIFNVVPKPPPWISWQKPNRSDSTSSVWRINRKVDEATRFLQSSIRKTWLSWRKPKVKMLAKA